MNWYNLKTSLYKNAGDVVGEAVEVFHALFYGHMPHLETLDLLQALDPLEADYKLKSKKYKSMLPLWAPSACLNNRQALKAGEQDNRVKSHTGAVQIDFDFPEIKDYDTDELKQMLFSLPFVAYVGRSCSGYGLWALALINEPEHQKKYMQHIFDTLENYGVKADTSKGRNATDLRYVSYDPTALYRDDPTPLHISHFKADKAVVKRKEYNNTTLSYKGSNTALIAYWLKYIQQAQKGQRWETVQKVSYFLGGKGEGLQEIEQAIKNNSAFWGEEEKYIKCANHCYTAGLNNPL